MRKRNMTLLLTFVLVSALGTIASGQISGARQTRHDSASLTQPMVPLDEAQARALYNVSPLAFEPAAVRTDGPGGFVARGRGYGILLAANEVNLRLHRSAGQASIDGGRQVAIRMRLVGASRSSAGEALDPLPGLRHYLLGNDPAAWRQNVRTYGRVRYRNAWRGIDVVHYGTQDQLEFDFIVSPGGDPSNVRLAFDGVDAMDIDPAGDLVLSAGGSSLHVRKPVVYQDVDGQRQPIAGAYVTSGRRQVRFRVAPYDATRPLVIDPVIQYATYLGGGADDGATAVAVDASGHAYITGWTSSADFPERIVPPPVIRGVFPGNGCPPNGCPAGPIGNNDVFVAKIDPSKIGPASLMYVTVLGGRGDDVGRGIAMGTETNGSISAYVTGETLSFNFPTTLGSYQPSNLGNLSKGFVLKLDSTGSMLQYSTYLGGVDSNDAADAIAIDGAGAAYVTGVGSGFGFSHPSLPTLPTATWYSYRDWFFLWKLRLPRFSDDVVDPNKLQDREPACRNAMPFLAKLDPTGAQIEAWTFLPGCAASPSGSGRKLASNAASVWVTFRHHADLIAANGTHSVAVAQFDPLLSATRSYLVQPGHVPTGIEVNEAGDAFVTGQSRFGGTPWLMKLDLGFGTYTANPVLAFNGRSFAVKADTAGNVYVAWGFSFAQSGHLLAKYDPTGALVYSIPFNGILALDVDRFEGVYAAGVTSKPDSAFFPSTVVQANAFDPTCGTSAGPCSGDAFLVRFARDRVASATGAGDVTFTTADAGPLYSLAAVAEADMPAGKPAGVTFPFGFFAWTVTNLTAGQSVVVTMTFPAAVPTPPQYWKVINGVWTDVCQQIPCSASGNVLTVTITDGGIGDRDNSANGAIVDPGGVGEGGTSLDTTPPTVQCEGADGAWHTADVSLGCTASDAGSGLANAADASFALSTLVAAGTETSDATTDSREICDVAGNCATAGPIGGNRVDKKAPDIVVTRSPGPNENGWNNTNVVATFVATDGGSGVADLAAIDVAFTVEGANQSATRAFSDNAGNTASASIGGVNIDKTAPTLTGLPANCSIWPANHKLVQVASVVPADSLSGIKPGSLQIEATSNEPDDTPGSGKTAPDIVIAGPVVQVRAERSGQGAGRIYIIAATVFDLADNVLVGSGMCLVPHDQGK